MNEAAAPALRTAKSRNQFDPKLQPSLQPCDRRRIPIRIHGFSPAPVVVCGAIQSMPGPGRMIDLAPEDSQPRSGIGVQPIAIAAVALVLVLFGIGSIGLWRAFGNTSESDRAAAFRELQARTAQVSEGLAEKTRGIEATQQESIDQLQELQDQVQTIRRQIAAQQADAKKLSDQVTALTEAVENLRQSFASSQATEPSAADQSPRKRSRTAHRKRGRSRS
ncbi:hypothetical protein [Bradyrhizobium sp. ORS 86]|uniref:hypothetical protein n=1 Tax=Bradyrhizobium sp. ORS 86 TaxID=1685970 RepID=UPI00388E9F8E